MQIVGIECCVLKERARAATEGVYYWSTYSRKGWFANVLTYEKDELPKKGLKLAEKWAKEIGR